MDNAVVCPKFRETAINLPFYMEGDINPIKKKRTEMKIILASASPRRKEILECLGVEFTVVCADADESCELCDPCEYAMELARRKGIAVWNKLKNTGDLSDTVIISADTVVFAEGEILGKPRDREDAYRMLKMLSGSEHSVVTGIGITADGKTTVSFCETKVEVESIPDSEIWKYIDSGDPFDKAGGYGIQGAFSKWVKGITGCYFNVVGLPTSALNKLFFQVTGARL